MIAQRLATFDGFQMITPASETRCGFSDCKHASYIDGTADHDPYYHCDLFDRRTDGKRLPECLQACDPSVIAQMRQAAIRYLSSKRAESVVVPFPALRRYRPDRSEGLERRTLTFYGSRCACPRHGLVLAAHVAGEHPECPQCASRPSTPNPTANP